MASNGEVTQGSTNVGFEYEFLVSAYFSLKLMEKNFDFTLRNSSAKSEKFDDVEITIKNSNNNENKVYGFQLKHRKQNTLKAKELSGQNKSFGIGYYANKCKEENIVRVLLTNVTFEELENLNRISYYTVTRIDNPSTSPCSEILCALNLGECHKIEKQEENDNFHDNYYLFSQQKNHDEVKNTIIKNFKKKFNADEEQAINYINFFDDFRHGRYQNNELTKSMVIIKLISILLKPYIIKNQFVNNTKTVNEINLIENAIKSFDLTILGNECKEIIENNFKINEQTDMEDLAKKENFIPSYYEKLDDENKRQIVLYLYEKLLFLDVNKNSKKTIFSAIRLCKNTNIDIKFVLLMEDGTQKIPFNDFSIFHNLGNLKETELYEKLIKLLKVSLQGRDPIALESLDAKVREEMTPNQIFKMLKGNFEFGEKLPQPQKQEDRTRRKLVKQCFSLKLLKEMKFNNEVLIINCGNNLEQFQDVVKNMNLEFCIILLDEYLNFPEDAVKKSILILTNKLFCNREELEAIYSKFKKKNVHEFRLLADNNLEWLTSKKSPEKLKASQAQVSVEFDEAEVYSGQRLNVICEKPGAGKTELMKYVAHKYPEYWIVYLSLNEVKNEFNGSDLQAILNSIMKIDEKSEAIQDKIKKIFLEIKKVVFFFDDFSENIINFIKHIYEEGYIIWISSKYSLKNKVEYTLQLVTTYRIKGLVEEEQKEYIEHSLQKKLLNRKKITKAMDEVLKIFPLLPQTILEIPRHLNFIAEIVSKLNSDNIVCCLYNNIIDKKMEPYLLPLKTEGKENMINHLKDWYLQQYYPMIIKFHLKFLKEEHQTKSKENFPCDVLDIIDGDKVEAGFGEYLAASYLADNFKSLGKDMKPIFQEKNELIKFYFDLQLAEERPLHLSIIYKNLSKFDKQIAKKNVVGKLDHGGRLPLHLASSIGVKHPSEFIEEIAETLRQEDQSIHEKILNDLLNFQQSNPLQKDKIFEWNSFQYADASRSLYSMEQICKTRNGDFSLDYLSNYNKSSLCNYCENLNYIHLLGAI